MTTAREAGPESIDVLEVLADNKLRGFPLAATIVLSAVIVIDGIDVILLGLLAPAVADEFKLSSVEIGSLLAVQQIGIVAASVLGGLAGDYLGRRRLVLLSLVIFAAGSFLSAAAATPEALVAARILGGLGLGAISPNLVAYMSEILPRRWKSQLIAVIFVFLALGSALGTLLVAFLASEVGWRGLFAIGGILPLAFVPVVLLTLPESPSHLIRRGASPAQVAKVLNRMCGTQRFGEANTYTAGTAKRGSEASLAALFKALPWRDVLSLWAFFFTLQLAYTVVTNMGTTLLTHAGWAFGPSVQALSAFNWAGLAGALGMVLIMPRLGSRRTMPAMCALGAGALVAIVLMLGAAQGASIPVLVAFGALGFSIAGLAVTAYPLAANVFPSAVLSGGIGTTVGIGRFATIVAPSAAGWLAGAAAPVAVFATLIPVMIGSAVALLVLKSHISPVSGVTASASGPRAAGERPPI